METVMVDLDVPLTQFQDANNCQECKVEFGYLWGRRHHCRRCNRSFCNSCSDGYFPLPNGNATPVRHCGHCATTPRELQQESEWAALTTELDAIIQQIQEATKSEDYQKAAALKPKKDEVQTKLKELEEKTTVEKAAAVKAP